MREARDFTQFVEADRCRKSLYFPLNAITLRIPALRERHADMPLARSARPQFGNRLTYTCSRAEAHTAFRSYPKAALDALRNGE